MKLQNRAGKKPKKPRTYIDGAAVGVRCSSPPGAGGAAAGVGFREEPCAGGKSGHRRAMVLANGQAGQPDGKWNRKYTADGVGFGPPTGKVENVR